MSDGYFKKISFLILSLSLLLPALFKPVASYAETGKKGLEIDILPEMHIFKQCGRFESLVTFLTGIEISLKVLSYGNNSPGPNK